MYFTKYFNSNIFFIVIIIISIHCFRYGQLLNSIKYSSNLAFKYNIYFSLTPVSYSNKTDHHDTTEILLKVALNTITLTLDTREVYQYTELVCLW